MKNRFVLALLASIAMHLILLEMVVALELLWPTARQADERQFIPVALLAVNRPAASSMLPLPDTAGAAKNLRPDRVEPRKALARREASARESAGPAEKIPPPAEVATCTGPTDQLPPEPEDRQEQLVTQPAASAAMPADTLPPAGLTSPGDAELCVTAAGPGDAISGAGRADGGSSEGDAAGRGGQGDGKAGAGAILIPNEFLAGNTPPRYPLIARRKGWEGTVVIDIRVSGGGQVQEARVDKSSGYTVLDDAALGAVRNWRIALHGRSAAASFKFRVPVIFKLTPS